METRKSVMCYKSLTSSLLTFFVIGFLFFSWGKTLGDDIIAKKTTTIIVNLLKSEDPVEFSEKHDIELKDGMLKVVITIDENLLSEEDLVSKYDLKDIEKRKNTVIAYVSVDELKELCNEPGVIFIRLPFKFIGK